MAPSRCTSLSEVSLTDQNSHNRSTGPLFFVSGRSSAVNSAGVSPLGSTKVQKPKRKGRASSDGREGDRRGGCRANKWKRVCDLEFPCFFFGPLTGNQVRQWEIFGNKRQGRKAAALSLRLPDGKVAPTTPVGTGQLDADCANSRAFAPETMNQGSRLASRDVTRRHPPPQARAARARRSPPFFSSVLLSPTPAFARDIMTAPRISWSL